MATRAGTIARVSVRSGVVEDPRHTYKLHAREPGDTGPFLEALDQFNEETRALTVGRISELVPLPTSSQFLNVMEGVLSGMTRAVINSDYRTTAQMKRAISKHFSERNEHFRLNPRRVGKKIWEFDFFQDFDALRAGNYKER